MKKFLKWYIPLFLIAALVIFVVYKTNFFRPVEATVDAVQQDQNPAAAPSEGSKETLAVLSQEEDKKITTGTKYSEKLVEDGTRNILIIGEDKLNDLYDTIGIASIDEKTKKLKLIMIPRDTYIEYGSEVMGYLEKAGRSKSPGIYKINCAHHVGSLFEYKGKFDSGPTSFLAQIIKEKFDIDVDDYVKINTKGFASLVDLFGGVGINVPYDMNYEDPTQDLIIHLKKGQQQLDGGQAEGFVRFRQGYREDGTFFEIGDTGRKKNQLAFMQAFIKQHGTITNINKLPSLIKLLGKNVQHSIGVGDVLQVYMKLGRDIISNKFEIESMNLDGKQTKINGSAYLLLE